RHRTRQVEDRVPTRLAGLRVLLVFRRHARRLQGLERRLVAGVRAVQWNGRHARHGGGRGADGVLAGGIPEELWEGVRGATVTAGGWTLTVEACVIPRSDSAAIHALAATGNRMSDIGCRRSDPAVHRHARSHV